MTAPTKARYSVACTVLISCLLLLTSRSGSAQGWDDVGFWAADFTLNALQYQAAAQELEEYRKTYEVLKTGYKVVRELVTDQNSLHENYFRDLTNVNPVVGDFYKVALTVQTLDKLRRVMNRDLPVLLTMLEESQAFTPHEIEYLAQIGDGMIRRMGSSLTEIMLVVGLNNDNKLQMLDSERVRVIDTIHAESQKMSMDIQRFVRLITGLLAQRTNQSVLDIEYLFSVRP